MQVPESILFALLEEPSWQELKTLEFGSEAKIDKAWLGPKAAHYS